MNSSFVIIQYNAFLNFDVQIFATNIPLFDIVLFILARA